MIELLRTTDPVRLSWLVALLADAGIEAACAGGFDSAGIGDAAVNPKATYGMKSFSDLLEIAK